MSAESNHIIIETERCYLRNWSVSDAEETYKLNADQEVLKYTGDVDFKNIAKAKRFIQNYQQYTKYGMGRWVVIRKFDKQFLGWCGLRYSEETKIVDLGFRFHKRYWSQGFASECASACLEYGFENLKLEIIIARARYDNEASIRVIEKLNMKFDKEIMMDGFKAFQYYKKA